MSSLLWTMGLGSILPWTAFAQIAPVAGGHYAEHATGVPGGASGYYGTSVPLDLPAARGNLPVPLQVVYGGRNVGAAGMGWDVPLSYIFRSASIAHRRPMPSGLFTSASATSASATRASAVIIGSLVTPPVHYTLSLGGEQIELVRNAADNAWVAARGNTMLEVRTDGATGMVLYDGEGRTYRFSSVGASSGSTLVDGNLYLLRDVTARGNTLHLDYTIGAPPLPPLNEPGLSIDLASVSYNTHPTTANCFKNKIQLTYDTPAPPDAQGHAAPALSMSVLNDTLLARVVNT